MGDASYLQESVATTPAYRREKAGSIVGGGKFRGGRIWLKFQQICCGSFLPGLTLKLGQLQE